MPNLVYEDLDRDLRWITHCLPVFTFFTTFESGHIVEGSGLHELLEAWFQIVNVDNILSGYVVFLRQILFRGGVNIIWVECSNYTTRVERTSAMFRSWAVTSSLTYSLPPSTLYNWPLTVS